VSKEEADNIFGMNWATWETYAKSMRVPQGWTMQLQPLDTGTSVMSFNTDGAYISSVQPLYSSPNAPSPEMLIVGSYYPKWSIPENAADFQAEIKQAAQADLGSEYSVTVILADIPPFEGVELHISRAEHEPIKHFESPSQHVENAGASPIK
jgi:hypothetical protein